MPLLLLPPTACAAARALVASSRLPPSRLRCSHITSAFPRLRKYGHRRREPVAGPFSDDDDDDEEEEEEAEDEDYDEEDEDGEEMAVDEDEFLATRPKPVGFGEGKTYSTDIEEQLLREMGLGRARRKGDATSANRREGNGSAKETSADLRDNGVLVRVWNLPKKKNIHKDLKQAFKGFPGLLSIDPAVSANKKTRDPICKGFGYLKLESADAATRFIEIYSRKPVAFGKVQKPISCCIVDGNSSAEPSNKASRAISQPRLKRQDLVAAS
ncbi:hypothetical protein HU200_011544 [Digitaria exilis]|uniref:RRM domain-containing protein n=1 Tax=Digitaria exilis TaxID=1010633 RepID=A0A835FI03_9POAL|nr:hypothetical protein HU200_011544 [Digitaria exilis]CAB3446405.1 unnamed protein product [Digitaria exilis]